MLLNNIYYSADIFKWKSRIIESMRIASCLA